MRGRALAIRTAIVWKPGEGDNHPPTAAAPDAPHSVHRRCWEWRGGTRCDMDDNSGDECRQEREPAHRVRGCDGALNPDRERAGRRQARGRLCRIGMAPLGNLQPGSIFLFPFLRLRCRPALHMHSARRPSSGLDRNHLHYGPRLVEHFCGGLRRVGDPSDHGKEASPREPPRSTDRAVENTLQPATIGNFLNPHQRNTESSDQKHWSPQWTLSSAIGMCEVLLRRTLALFSQPPLSLPVTGCSAHNSVHMRHLRYIYCPCIAHATARYPVDIPATTGAWTPLIANVKRNPVHT